MFDLCNDFKIHGNCNVEIEWKPHCLQILSYLLILAAGNPPPPMAIALSCKEAPEDLPRKPNTRSEWDLLEEPEFNDIDLDIRLQARAQAVVIAATVLQCVGLSEIFEALPESPWTIFQSFDSQSESSFPVLPLHLIHRSGLSHQA